MTEFHRVLVNRLLPNHVEPRDGTLVMELRDRTP
jgi:hypothetical protein